jgi:hypothetical protein
MDKSPAKSKKAKALNKNKLLLKVFDQHKVKSQ